jgi:hypothetical protein
MNTSSIAERLAQAVAPHFSEHTASPTVGGEGPGVPPDTRSITTMVETAFWASLRREEGYVPTISLAYISPFKHSHEKSSNKFVNVVVLEGDRIKVLDQNAVAAPDCPGVITSLLGLDHREEGESTNILVQIAVSVRDHGRGRASSRSPSSKRLDGISPATRSVRCRSSFL